MASELKRFDVFSPDIYVALTNWLWHDAPTLGQKARGVFLALAGSFNPDLKTHIGIDRMADRTGWSRKSVQRGLAELEDAGVIDVQRRFANSSEITLAAEVAYSVNLTETRDGRFGQSDRKGDDCSVNLTSPFGHPDLRNTDRDNPELKNNVNNKSASIGQPDRKVDEDHSAESKNPRLLPGESSFFAAFRRERGIPKSTEAPESEEKSSQPQPKTEDRRSERRRRFEESVAAKQEARQ